MVTVEKVARRRHAQFVAPVLFPIAANGHVGGQHDGLVAGCLGPLQQFAVEAAVTGPVALEPLVAVEHGQCVAPAQPA